MINGPIEFFKGDTYDELIYGIGHGSDSPEDMTGAKIRFTVRPTLPGTKSGYRKLITDASGEGEAHWTVDNIFYKSDDVTKIAKIIKVSGSDAVFTIEYELITGTDFIDDDIIKNLSGETLAINGTPTDVIDPLLELASMPAGGDATEIEGTDPEKGEVKLHIKVADTIDLDAGKYFYDIQCTYSGDAGTKTIAQNIFILKEDIVKNDDS